MSVGKNSLANNFSSKRAIKDKLKEIREFRGELDIHKIIADAGDIWIRGTPDTFERLISDFLTPLKTQKTSANDAFIEYFLSTWGTPNARFSVWKYGQYVAFNPQEAERTNNIAETSHGVSACMQALTWKQGASRRASGATRSF